MARGAMHTSRTVLVAVRHDVLQTRPGTTHRNMHGRRRTHRHVRFSCPTRQWMWGGGDEEVVLLARGAMQTGPALLCWLRRGTRYSRQGPARCTEKCTNRCGGAVVTTQHPASSRSQPPDVAKTQTTCPWNRLGAPDATSERSSLSVTTTPSLGAQASTTPVDYRMYQNTDPILEFPFGGTFGGHYGPYITATEKLRSSVFLLRSFNFMF